MYIIFGTLWANSNISSTTLKHECGHSIQERILGPFYLGFVAFPSAYYCYFGDYRDEFDQSLKEKMYFLVYQAGNLAAKLAVAIGLAVTGLTGVVVAVLVIAVGALFIQTLVEKFDSFWETQKERWIS